MLVLFDLDGTLTDSAPGITRSVQHAFDRMGYAEYSQAELETFVGPPLNEQFMSFAGMGPEQAAEAVRFFRERYETVGKFENSLYPGISEMLESLKKAGMRIGMATSKPEHFAKQIAEHFGISAYFDYISAASMDETRTSKPAIIEEALRQSGFDTHREDACMVGDRRYDIEGAKTAGIRSVGVLYGYGSRAELEAAGADRLVQSVRDLQDMLLRN